jgi:hypothetical protein
MSLTIKLLIRCGGCWIEYGIFYKDFDNFITSKEFSYLGLPEKVLIINKLLLNKFL